MMRSSALLASSLTWLLACGSDPFTCDSNSQCVQADGAGICQPSGYCSFPDSACASGQRYGSHAGGGLAGRCVHDDPSTTSGITVAVETGTGEAPDDDTTLATTTSSATTSGSTTTNGSTDEAMTDPHSTETTESEPLDPDLVAWYRFEGVGSDIAEDASSNALHGTCTACPSSTPGLFGNAAAFDGMTELIVLPDDAAFDLTEAFTLAAWVRVEDWPTDVGMILGRPLGRENNNSWEMFTRVTNAGAHRIYYYVADTLETVVGFSVDVDDPNAWIHVGMTWDGAWVRMYLDGEPRGQTGTAQVAYDAHTARIGADVDHGSDDNFFSGAIDDVRIYSRALDADEIALLATAP